MNATSLKPHRHFWLICLAGIGLLSGCHSDVEPTQTVQKLPLVAVNSVPSGPRAQTLQLSGQIRAREEANLGFRVAGKIARRLVDAGEHFEAGAPLYTLDQTDYLVQLKGAQAQEALSQARLQNAADELERIRRLLEQSVVSQAQFDRTHAAWQQAKAALDAATAARENAANSLEYTTLRATAPGIVNEILGDEGQVVAAGQPILTIAALDQLEAEIYLPERYVNAVKIGDRVKVTPSFSSTGQFEGTVREIAGMADPRSRTYRARVELASDDALPRLGASIAVEVSIPFSVPVAPLPPESLCGETGGSPYVWILDDNDLAQRRPVLIKGATDGNFLVTGLQPGERVVTSGARFLHQPTQVRIAPVSNAN